MAVETSGWNPRGFVGWAVALGVMALAATPARAAFHLWQIQEVYSNSSGTLQFVELVDQFGFQTAVAGQSINSLDSGGNPVNTFMIPFSTSLPGDSLNHMLLFGTSGIHAAGGPAPDFIIPDNFLRTGGGSIGFFGLNGGAYNALPTDGTQSLNWFTGTANAVNSPVNYLGETGTVSPVPEPATLALTSVAMAGGVYCWRRRRTAPLPAAG